MLRKPLLLGAAVAALSATPPAFAADMPTTPVPMYTEPAPVASAHDWSGLYVGANAGYFFGNTDLGPLPPVPLAPLGMGTDGFTIGGQVGYNWQIDRFVLGGEADLDWANVDGSHGIPGGSVAVSSDWLSTVRGRAGVAFDRVLVYGTGGVAFTSLDASAVRPLGAASDSNTLTGWTAGAGVEVALTDNLSVKGEYLWVDFGNDSYALGGGPATPVDLSGSYARIGLNYKLNLF